MRNKHVVNKTADVEKFAGKMSTHTRQTGHMSGINVPFKSLMLSCFFDNVLAMNKITASFAKSEVWKEILTIGSVNQRLASLRFVPIKRVSNKSGMARKIVIREMRE